MIDCLVIFIFAMSNVALYTQIVQRGPIEIYVTTQV